MSQPEPSTRDINSAHRHFAAKCFNRTWDLIEKPDRTPDDDEAMILCATASLWHWTQRDDCADSNLSVGHWQVARVYALLGQGENAMRHARHSLEFADGSPPFYRGYAHEAAARAALVLADTTAFRMHLDKARSCAAAIEDADERAPLERDLDALKSSAASPCDED